MTRTRALVRRPILRIVAASIAIAYAFVSMLIGGMLEIFIPPAQLTSFWLVIPAGTPWWDYPGLLVVTPGFVLGLPFLPTVSMVLVSAGVGVGMTVAVGLSVKLLRRRRTESGSPVAVSSVAGLTPAMIALVTLGACCSTTAAATAGVGLAAQVSGTSVNSLLVNNWYLGLFQIGVLYAALLAQEQLLAVYGYLFAPGGASRTALDDHPSRGWSRSRPAVAVGVLRVALLAGGATWVLTMFAEWTTVSPMAASAGTWVSWLGQNVGLGLLAVLAALAPFAVAGFFRDRRRWPIRVALVIFGYSLAGWDPPAVAGWGLFGFVNELFGAFGLPSSFGAVDPGQPVGLALILRWALQFVLLGGFAVWVGWTSARRLSGTRVLDRADSQAASGPRRMRNTEPVAMAANPLDERTLGLPAMVHSVALGGSSPFGSPLDVRAPTAADSES